MNDAGRDKISGLRAGSSAGSFAILLSGGFITLHFRKRISASLVRKTSLLFVFMLVFSSSSVPGRASLPASRARSETNRTLASSQELKAQTLETLKLGETITRQIRGGESQSFSISLAAGQFVHLRVEQHGSILLATLFDPQRGEVVQMDYPAGGHGPIYLSAIASEPGNYQLEIRSKDKWANPANFELTLETLRTTEATDLSLINAEKLFAEGRKNFRSSKASAAVDYYSRTLAFWDAANDHHWRALTQYALSEAYRNLGDRNNAELCLDKALAILNVQMSPSDWRLKAAGLNDLGSIYTTSRLPQQALSPLNEALTLFLANSDRRGQASVLNNLARVQDRLGNLNLARELIDKASTLRKAENDQGGVANLLNTLGVISDRLGEPETALDYYTLSLEAWEKIDDLQPSDRTRVATVLNNLATGSDKLGRWDQALLYYDKALARFDVGDPNRAATLDNKGELFASLGDPKKAEECYKNALLLLSKSKPDRDVKAGLLVHIGQLAMSQGDLSSGLGSFEEARDLEPSPRKQADVFTNLGAVLALKGDLVQALENYQKALDIQLRLKDRRGQALTLQKRGEAYALLGKKTEAQALDELNDALNLWRAVKDQRGEAATLLNVAIVERDRGNMTGALANSNKALAIIESLRTRLSSRQLRASYFANRENYYEVDIDLKMQLSNSGKASDSIAAALESSEKARARVLLDALSEAGVGRNEINSAFAPNHAGLAAQRNELLEKLSSKAQARTKLLSVEHSPAQVTLIDKEIETTSERLDVLDVQIRAGNPRFAMLTKPQPATLNEIQEQLDADTLLLEYALGEKRSYVWAVTPNSIHGFELQGRERIETVASRAIEALTARNREVKNEGFPQRQSRIAKAEADYSVASAELSKLIIEPVVSELGQKRLVIVADGALQLVPFAALPAPVNAIVAPGADLKTGSKDNRTSFRPRLIDQHEIISEPSASVLALQRREFRNRQRAPLAVAVLADPVYDDQDARVAKAMGVGNQHRKDIAGAVQGGEVITAPGDKKSTPLSKANSALSNALRDVGMNEEGKLPRLGLSRREARAIARAVSPDQSLTALDFKASRQTATSPELSKYRIIHFATHGVLDLDHPELSGIVLSMVDEKGQPQDGYLRLHEIYNLNLPAELVVLSACQTGIGKQIKGEGLIALTRGFMYAGAKSVVASFWKVDDAATSELMAEFYKQMFTNKLKPAAALRAAQMRMSQQKRWQSPYYWAGFFLQGEWN